MSPCHNEIVPVLDEKGTKVVPMLDEKETCVEHFAVENHSSIICDK